MELVVDNYVTMVTILVTTSHHSKYKIIITKYKITIWYVGTMVYSVSHYKYHITFTK